MSKVPQAPRRAWKTAEKGGRQRTAEDFSEERCLRPRHPSPRGAVMRNISASFQLKVRTFSRKPWGAVNGSREPQHYRLTTSEHVKAGDTPADCWQTSCVSGRSGIDKDIFTASDTSNRPICTKNSSFLSFWLIESVPEMSLWTLFLFKNKNSQTVCTVKIERTEPNLKQSGGTSRGFTCPGPRTPGRTPLPAPAHSSPRSQWTCWWPDGLRIPLAALCCSRINPFRWRYLAD